MISNVVNERITFSNCPMSDTIRDVRLFAPYKYSYLLTYLLTLYMKEKKVSHRITTLAKHNMQTL